jgi:hypothetical protein
LFDLPAHACLKRWVKLHSYVQNNNLACICIKGYGRRVFDIQNAKLAKAFRLEGESFKPGKWENKFTFKKGRKICLS